MKIFIKTKIGGSSPEAVLKAFDIHLFKALAPKFPKMKINRFDGSELGCIIDVSLEAGLIKQRWVSKITERHVDANIAWFKDEGIRLPFFLKFWSHKHIVLKSDGHLYIIDDILFKSHFFLTTLFIYPFLYFQFRARKPVYRRWFKQA